MKKLEVKPFFTDEEISAVSENKSQDTACMECGLYKSCKSPKMPHTGEGRRKTLIIEDDKNIQLIGDTEQYLRDLLADRGLNLDEDFWKTNAVICRPLDNKKPTRKQLILCRPNYMKIIKELKPRCIWLLGAAAIESFFMNRFRDEEGTNLTPTRWRGLCIPDPKLGAWVIPIFHPSYAKRNERDELIQAQYKRDLDFAVSCLDKEPPIEYKTQNKVILLKDYDAVENHLNGLIKNPPKYLIHDYEATGLKPFNKGHKIAMVSYCCEEDKAFAFPLEYPYFNEEQQNKLKFLWGEVLLNDSKKVAHNLKFEDVWSRRIINVLTKNWHWCTMNGAHILDNRANFTGLKFQAFIRWGIEDYSRKVRPFLQSKKGSEFNRVMEAPLDDLLLYGGIDSLLEGKLFFSQREEISKKQKEGMFFFVEGLLALSDMQISGICADLDYYKDTDEELTKEMDKIDSELTKSNEAKLFIKERGRSINFNSDKDLRDLFFDIMKLPVNKKTDTGLPAVDAEVMVNINSSIAGQLSHRSKMDKIKGTYVGQFLREIGDDGKIHPFFDLHIPQTYRGSGSRPNMQNIPIRDEEAKKYTRSGIFPSPGNVLLDFDYKAMEVRVCACLSEDPVLIEYVESNFDMHTEEASNLFSLDKERVSKDLRHYGKNGFVFPEIYGSYYVNCAKNIWKACSEQKLKTKDGEDIFDHLYSVGINSLYEFEDHVKEVERDFWDKFKLVKKWQEKTWRHYEKNGYLDLVTGFRCSGYMSRNDLGNYPIQGPAFHCLLYSMIHINNHIQDRNLNTRIIAQIHDNLIFDCPPEEKDIIRKLSLGVATKQIREDWKWIIVPLSLEFSTTEVDASWYTKREIK